MKFIKSYNELINESSRFSHLKEVLDTIDDLTLDFKDVGGKVTFGRKSMTTEYQATFDEYLDDISIKMTSMGKNLIFLKFDIKEIKKLPNGKLSDESLELLIETLKSVCNYLVNEDLIVRGFWTKQLVANKNDYGKNTFFRFESIDQLIDDILGKNQIFVKYLLDTRIVFSGQSILEESMNVSDSDIEDIKDILDDFNSEHNDEGRTHVDAKLTHFSNSKHIVISDKTETYSGFSFAEIVPLILRLMSRFEIDSIRLGIVFIGRHNRDFETFTKDQLLSILNDDESEAFFYSDPFYLFYNKNSISNVSINLENFNFF
jgi:hypothetical protein